MQDLTLLMVLAAGYARSPEARKARHLERGDRYVKAEKYRDAIIEYRNVLRIEVTNAAAIRQLGLAHFQLGEMGQAFRFLLRAQELEPDNAEVRLKLASIYLLGGKPDEARAQAEAVLCPRGSGLEISVSGSGFDAAGGRDLRGILDVDAEHGERGPWAVHDDVVGERHDRAPACQLRRGAAPSRSAPTRTNWVAAVSPALERPAPACVSLRYGSTHGGTSRASSHCRTSS
ncbi:MAG: tetratricopeptide repeat protein [Candidatus Rokubacteria bacterium]|nr:tetratricopeptide repeat protein [Candidatus Rokubacteria bacterium]